MLGLTSKNGSRDISLAALLAGMALIALGPSEAHGVESQAEIEINLCSDSKLVRALHLAEKGKPATVWLFDTPGLDLDRNGLVCACARGIHLMIGRRPYAAFGNTAGDQQMLEYTAAGDGARLMMLVLHHDAKREYAYGAARGLPQTKVGALNQVLYDQAKKNGWTVISMKDDWKNIFVFE